MIPLDIEICGGQFCASLMSNTNTGSEAEQVSYLNITFSQKGVSEFSGKQRAVFIPREEIQRIQTKTGSRAERPLVQGIAGVALLGLGLIGLRMFISNGVAFLRWEAGFLLFGGVGGWMLLEALRKGHYLLVVCSKGTRKLVFDKKISEPELAEFLRNATRLGYNCD